MLTIEDILKPDFKFAPIKEHQRLYYLREFLKICYEWEVTLKTVGRKILNNRKRKEAFEENNAAIAKTKKAIAYYEEKEAKEAELIDSVS